METNTSTTTTTTRRHTATAMRTAREEGDDADVFIVDVSSWVPIRRENDDDEDVVNRTASCPHSNRETPTTSRRDGRARAMAEHRSGGFAHPLGGYFTARRGSSARTEEEASKPRRWRRGKRAAQPPQSSASSESGGAFNWTTTRDDGIKMSSSSSSRSFSFGGYENDDPMGAAFAAARTVGCTKHAPADPTVGARMLVQAAQRRIDALRAARGATTVPSSSYSFDVPRLGGSRCTKYDAYR